MYHQSAFVLTSTVRGGQFIVAMFCLALVAALQQTKKLHHRFFPDHLSCLDTLEAQHSALGRRTQQHAGSNSSWCGQQNNQQQQ